jgi:ElaA protein
MEITWIYKNFHELSLDELYGILRLRAAVFVVEQNCVYQDVDDKDKLAGHIFGIHEGKIIAYSRIFKSGDYFQEASIGRVVVHPDYRRKGIAYDMMQYSIRIIHNQWNEPVIRISAQEYLLNFYKSLGFTPVGIGYLEDGIPHRSMVRRKL